MGKQKEKVISLSNLKIIFDNFKVGFNNQLEGDKSLNLIEKQGAKIIAASVGNILDNLMNVIEKQM